GIDPGLLDSRTAEELGYLARRPAYSAMSSKRGVLLPALDNAIDRYIHIKRDEMVLAYPKRKAGAS
ncbi:MAG TPA: hypothetical protein VFI43_08695, partial [Nitrosospira sp.]|nr:hypothetical protein [Nitrosospira sp.]